jgi:hypothetical protein
VEKQNEKSHRTTIRKVPGGEFLENDHRADSVQKFPAFTAAEQDWQFLLQKKRLGFRL